MKRVTVRFENEALYAAITAEAARRQRPLEAVVHEALREWLEARENEELAEGLDAIRAEWRDRGGIEAAEFFGQLDAEVGVARGL